MNFIQVVEEIDGNREVILINLDMVVSVVNKDGKALFNTVMGQYEIEAPVDEIGQLIEMLQHKAHRTRIDGLKGETLNVKVVNK